MPVPVYERRAGDHVAERIRVVAGGDKDEHYAAFVAAGTGNWSLAEESAPAPKRRGRPPNKKP